MWNLISCNLMSCAHLRFRRSIGSFSMVKNNSTFICHSSCSSKTKNRLFVSLAITIKSRAKSWSWVTRCRSSRS